jgi:hypothetical protein
MSFFAFDEGGHAKMKVTDREWVLETRWVTDSTTKCFFLPLVLYVHTHLSTTLMIQTIAHPFQVMIWKFGQGDVRVRGWVDVWDFVFLDQLSHDFATVCRAWFVSLSDVSYLCNRLLGELVHVVVFLVFWGGGSELCEHDIPKMTNNGRGNDQWVGFVICCQ